MTPQLRLNTSNFEDNRRYSFLETPLEMQPPGQRKNNDQQLPQPQPESRLDIHSVHQQAVIDQNQHQPPLNEKAQPLSQYPIASTYHSSLSPGQHPAYQAPYADEISKQNQKSYAVAPYYSHIVPPSSPGPLPVKVNPEASAQVQRAHTVTLAPDENPLHSPRLPQYPPPIVTSPTTTSNDTMLYHQPGQAIHPNQAIQGGTWNHSLCDCSSIGTCCLGLICPCILYGRTQYRLSMKSKKQDPTNMLGYETCNGSCTAMGLLCGCQWLLATIQHTRTRKAYGIQGDFGSDCIRATCCTSCTLIQDEKEIMKREGQRERVARASGAVLSPYMAPGQMSYGSPPK